MEIILYHDSLRGKLEDMLVTYFQEDLNGSIPESIIRGKLISLISDLHAQGVIHIAIAIQETKTVGFSIYQIDSQASDWCKRPGWGFVREFYIAKEQRRNGYGRTLAEYTEQQLRQLGARQLYLTSDEAAEFWNRCGYQLTDETCTNDLPILTKQ